MTDNMFDNFVRDKLADHKSPVPQGLWEKIERKKDKEPKVGFWFQRSTIWGGLLFILLGLGVGYFLLQDNKQTGDNNTSQLSGTAAAKNNGSATTNTNTTTATNTNQANTAGNNNTANETSTTANGNTGDLQQATGNNTVQDNSSSDNGNALTINTKTKNKRSAKQSAGNKTGDTNNDRDSYQDKPTKNNVVLLNGSKQKRGTSKSSIDKIVRDNKKDVDGDITATPITDNVLSLSRGVTAYDLRTFNLGAKDKFNLSEIRIFGIDCPTTGRPRRNDWFLEVYASPDIAMKSVSAKANPAYVAKKDSTETTQMGYTAGFRISKSISDKILLKTGLQYSQINERFDLKTENERRITTVITIRTIQTAAGIDTTIRDTSTLMQIGYRVQRTYNKYRSIDIPVLLSYEFGDEKWKFGLNAGVILNLHSWYNGEALNDSLNVVSLNSKSNSVYKQNIGVGVYAGFSIIKPVSKNLDVFVEPYFRYNLSNMAKGSAYTQKFNAAGISLGVRYNLKRQRR